MMSMCSQSDTSSTTTAAAGSKSAASRLGATITAGSANVSPLLALPRVGSRERCLVVSALRGSQARSSRERSATVWSPSQCTERDKAAHLDDLLNREQEAVADFKGRQRIEDTLSRGKLQALAGEARGSDTSPAGQRDQPSLPHGSQQGIDVEHEA